MANTLTAQLSGSALKSAILHSVATEGLDQIEPDFDDHARFVVAAVRAVARRQGCGMCALAYSDAPVPEGKPLGFERVYHMQEGHGDVSGAVVLTSRDANNGAFRKVPDGSLAGLMTALEEAGFDQRATVIWDENARVATVYPDGIASDANHARFSIPSDDPALTQDDICAVLNTAYEDNLKNASGGTIHLWRKQKLISGAEEEIERHLKGQIAMFFAGQERPVGVLRQMNTDVGRTDLVLVQRPAPGSRPQLCGVLELKVLRGPEKTDWNCTQEGLSQGYWYRTDLHLPFATLALFDVNDPPSDDVSALLSGQDPAHLANVRTRRFPLYGSPKEWRDAQRTEAAA